MDSTDTKAAFIRTRFHIDKVSCQNRCGLELFTRNRFRQKIKVVMLYESAALRAKFNILNRAMHISRLNSNRIQIDVVSLFTRQMKP